MSSRRLRPSSASTATLYRFRRTSVLEFPLGRYDIVSEAIDGKTVRTTKKQSTGPRGVEELGNLTVGFGIYMDTESERERERERFWVSFILLLSVFEQGKWKVKGLYTRVEVEAEVGVETDLDPLTFAKMPLV